MPNQPIGYVEPEPGAKLALGLADPMDAPALAPLLVSASGPPTTLNASYLGGTIFTGFGQAPFARDSQRLWGLNAT
jgi:hypothetical protein